MPAERLFQMFESKKNVLVQPKVWKDKWENIILASKIKYGAQYGNFGFTDDIVAQCWTVNAYAEAMWGIYAGDAGTPEFIRDIHSIDERYVKSGKNKRYLRIRSTPKKVFTALKAYSDTTQLGSAHIGKVKYSSEAELKKYATGFLNQFYPMPPQGQDFAHSLFHKRQSFNHEKEIRIVYFNYGRINDNPNFRSLNEDPNSDKRGLYYDCDPNSLITQIMCDPLITDTEWKIFKQEIEDRTGFKGQITKSEIYSPHPIEVRMGI